ncbi:MAG: peptidase, partial [Phycisphaerales bacterium]|nr:peptidase [Phycisphaerales bacterium]
SLPEVRDPEIIRAVGQCATLLRLRRSPIVLEAPVGTGPALAGVLRPRLLLPAAALRGLGRNELRLVVLHELVHLRRGDLALNWLLAVLHAVHWFNPLVWFTFARLRGDRELACDELVLSTSPPARRGDDCRDYGRAILKLLKPPSAGALPGLTVGVLERGGWARKAQLRRRITMIARFDRPAGRWPAFGVALSLLVGGVAFTGAVRGQDDPADKPADVPQQDATLPAAGGSALPPGSGARPADNTATPAAGAAAVAPQDESPASNGPVNSGVGGAAPSGAGPSDGAPSGGFQGAPAAPGSVAGGLPGAGGPGMAGGRSAPGIPSSPGGIAPPPGMMPGMPGMPPGAGRAGRPGMPGMMGMMGAPMGFGGGAVSAPAESPIGRVEDPEAAKADAKAAGLLRKSLAVSMQGVPLDEFLHYLSDQTGADIFLDTKALGEQQIVGDAPVTLHVKEPRSAESLLQLGLRSAGGNALGYEISNGLVIITTRSELNKSLVTRSYEVGRLIDTDGNVDLPTLIESNVAAGSWRAVGGDASTGGTIALFNRKLIVTTTEPNQREVAKLLSLLHDEPAERREPGFRPDGKFPKGPARKSGADPAPVAPTKPGSPPDPRDAGEGPSSTIKADQLEFRIDPNVTVTARGNVEVREKAEPREGAR